MKWGVITNNVLITTLGDSPRMRILAFLMENPFDCYTMGNIAKYVGMTRQSVYKNIKPLIAVDLVHNTERIGNTNLYQFANSHPAEALETFATDLVMALSEEEE